LMIAKMIQYNSNGTFLYDFRWNLMSLDKLE
jgi:hypothetical protein